MRRKASPSQIAKLDEIRSIAAQSAQRQDFTYKKLVGLRLKDVSFKQSLFIGAILQDCEFVAVDFGRCDFSGAKFVNCAFENCQFVPDEIRSCIVNTCSFSHCDFRGSQWQKLQVQSTQFLRCDFRETSLRENHFRNCTFVSSKLRKSSLTLSEFSVCAFSNVNLGDCTALFLFFNECKFRDCHINAETIGLTYGLTADDLEALDLIYLGRKQAKPAGNDLLDSLILSYTEKKWHVGACVLELNFLKAAPLNSIRRLVEFLEAAGNLGVYPDWDELRFFVEVLRRLRSEDRLPLFGLWSLISCLHKISEPLSNNESIGLEFGANAVLADADRILMGMLDDLAPTLSIRDSQEKVWLDLHLADRPVIDLAALIPDEAYLQFSNERPVLIGGKHGSWFETWQLALGSLAAIHVTLVAVSGVLRRFNSTIAEAKKLVGQFRKKESPKPKKSKRRAIAVRSGTQTIAITEEVEIVRTRIANLSPDALIRLDKTLAAIKLLKSTEIDSFEAYSTRSIRGLRVRKPPMGSAKKNYRAHHTGA